MAKRAKARASRTPQRKTVRRKRGDESLLLRSAESLGRVIGALQRQLERRRSEAANLVPRVKKSSGARKRTVVRRKSGK